MSVLVTGAAGYIGSHTCLEMLRAGREIVALDNYSNSKQESLRRVRELTGKDFPEYECDIRDEGGLRGIFSCHEIDAVIHFAGLKAVSESCRVPLDYFDNNVCGSVTLCHVMHSFGVKRMIFSSSATVYGDNISPLREDMPMGKATNPYGRTKQVIEQILQDLYVSDHEWSVVLLRYFNPVGADQSGRIGESPNGIPNNLTPYISQVAVGKLAFLPVYGNDYDTPDGTCIRDYIHVTDLASGHVKALDYADRNQGLQAVNLGTGRGYSVLEMIHAFEKASGRKIDYQFAPRREGDLPVLYADPAKAERLLHFKTQLDIDKMCEDLWRWQSQNPNGF